MYKLLRSNLLPYVRDRVQARLFLPMALFLVLAAEASGLAPSSSASTSVGLLQWPIMLLLSYSMILQWRLWDDLKDRDHDQEKHPGRLLCQTSDIKPYYTVLLILMLCNGLAVLLYQENAVRGAAYLATYAAATLFFFCWYRWRPASAAQGLTNSHLILLKYPLISWLIAGQTQHPLILISVYLSCLALEFSHDRVLRKKYSPVLGGYLAVLFACWLYIIMMTTNMPLFQWIHSVLLAGVAVYYIMLFRRYSLYLSYGLIIISSLIYLTLIIEKIQ
ncbi:MAG: hypothetical protein D3924_07175 [Candidatus Electrothrix sp. AR4]|nr:hypothetical protein [Candidatus Electrothrix sp. AR4]